MVKHVDMAGLHICWRQALGPADTPSISEATHEHTAHGRVAIPDSSPRMLVDGTPETVVLLSGGADSAACLAFYANDVGRLPHALFVDYRQPAVRQEALAARRIARHYGILLETAKWIGPRRKTGGFTPARNALLLSAALMERPASATAVAIGIHSETDYSDCTSDFVVRMQALYDIYCNTHVKVVAPFLDWTKSEIWAYAKSQGVPLTKTYSCEVGGTNPCMKCQSCLDRRALDDQT